jgi:hypothetical protein
MKKIDLGQALGIVANIGVIASIVFLGAELRQNNAIARTDAYDRNAESMIAWRALMISEGLVDDWENFAFRGVASEDRQPDVGFLNHRLFINLEKAYFAHENGVMADSGWERFDRQLCPTLANTKIVLKNAAYLTEEFRGYISEKCLDSE